MFFRKAFMLSWILIFFAQAQVNPLDPPPVMPVFSREWCLENARMKDELVGRGGCKWLRQPNHQAIVVSDPIQRYICKDYPAQVSPYRPEGSRYPYPGYEGRLSCPSPFTGAPDYIIFECATCTADDYLSGNVDAKCRQTMYDAELQMCNRNAQKFQYFHDIDGLRQIPGGPIPPPD